MEKKQSIFDPRTGLWVLIAANIIAFSDHSLWVELILISLLLALMMGHGRFTMAVKWAAGYCALLVFQQVILPVRSRGFLCRTDKTSFGSSIRTFAGTAEPIPAGLHSSQK